VNFLEKKIEEENPTLIKTREIVMNEKEQLEEAAEKAEEQGKLLYEKKTIADAKKDEVENEKNQIENEIKKAEPFLNEAYSKIKKVDEKQISELFNYPKPNVKMFDLLELFLEVWKIKVQKIVWEFDEITEKGVIKKAKSVFKTCKTLSKQCKLKDEMIDFPRNELKYHPDVMQEIIPKFKELNKEELGKISVALTAIYEFMNIMIT